MNLTITPIAKSLNKAYLKQSLPSGKLINLEIWQMDSAKLAISAKASRKSLLMKKGQTQSEKSPITLNGFNYVLLDWVREQETGV